MPEGWAGAWDLWQKTTGPHLSRIDGEPAPDANDQWMFFQAILGAWPLELMEGEDRPAVESFRERLNAYAEKAMREGKRRSSWVNVDETYEGTVRKLFEAIIAPGSDFLRELRPFAQRLAHLGMLAGLGRTVLKTTLPGLPDTYQGTEIWDFSFVDPDNRRPVDYAALTRMIDGEGEVAPLLAHWPDGRVKQATLHRMLAERAARPEFFARAGYEAVDATGERAAHVLAFRRTDLDPAGEGDLVVAVPRLFSGLVGDTMWSGEAFAGTTLALGAGTRWRDVVTGRAIDGEGADAGTLFRDLPYAVLRRVG
jgi:(1->4)-alpha-D-glucan 1-alpha-D-glucosylmutase